MADDLLQTKQMAELLNVPPRQVVEWAVAGLLPSLGERVGRGKSRWYAPATVERGQLLCRLVSANIQTRDLRRLIPIIEAALAEDPVLSVPYPIKAGNRLYTLCQVPMKGPVLIEGVPPGQTVIPLIALDDMTPEGRARVARDK